ncbi:MAG: molybdate ABC transporter permease subunit [Thermodesulfobacteriota bacterium]
MEITPADLDAVWLSVKVATVATALAIPVAFLLAAMLVYTRWRITPLLDGIVNLPLVLPPVVVGYLLLLLCGRQGPIGEILSALDIQLIFTWKAAVLACTIIGLPLLIRSVRLGMEQIDPHLLHAARSLGASRTNTLIHIILPLSLPAIATGSTLAFARSLGEFGATIILAGNIPGVTQTIPLAIYDYTNTPGGEQGALVLCLISIAISYVMLLLNEGLRRHWNRQH